MKADCFKKLESGGMPFPASALLRLAAALFLAVACPIAQAQDAVERPEPGTVAVPSQDDEAGRDEPAAEEATPGQVAQEAERRGKFGFVRLWNFAAESAGDGVGVFLARGSSVPPPDQRQWLGRGSRPGELRDYTEFEPGNFEVFVLRDASRQGAMVALAEKFEPETDNLLGSRVALRVRPGGHYTVLVHDDGGRLAARVLDDSGVEPKRLRLFNFTREFTPDISALAGEKRAVLAENLAGETVIDMPDAARIVTLEVAYPTSVEGFIGRMNVECDFSRVRSCSLSVFYDRYGRLTARGVEDAPR